ncbi:bifunctional glycosyltransferase family 2 protein/CDP-glycerol:glycerophosphate glycerophosphotransferase [Phycicoccus jejuensis]|uniref:bifunctional glycosyltransferase/CDP-glycerol:glycerophosphate glycerophosphotransferase n=1 Tax=Phycicoccus jejuensis TaxID=367299 RepID=UPI00384C85FB
MRRPFGAVVAVYGVEKYVQAFLDSLEQQTVPLEDIDLVFVDDESPDASGAIIQQWIDTRAPHARLFRQPNGGPASARNLGLRHVDADWVHFPDPDDMLDPEFYASVRPWVTGRRGRAVDLVSTPQIFLSDRTGELSDTHALRRKFRGGSQLVNLERHPEYIHLQSGSALYRLDRIREHGLEFPTDVRPNFEDAFFTALYLGLREAPTLAVVREARYLYRRRDDGSSLIQSSWRNPDKYLLLPRVGYLRLAERLAYESGELPLWAQTLLLYDLLFYFREDARTYGQTGWLDTETAQEFLRTVAAILQHVADETIESFALVPTSRELRLALVMGLRGSYSTSDVALSFLDRKRELVRVTYYFAGERPVEEFRVRGRVVSPRHAKDRAVQFFGQTLISQRIVWLPANGTIRMTLDGRPVPLDIGQSPDPVYTARPVVYWRKLANSRPPEPSPTASPRPAPRTGGPRRRALRRAKASARLGLQTVERYGKSVEGWAHELRLEMSPTRRQERADRLAVRIARTKRVRTRYEDAWILMDRDVQAGDNAEHLYRWLMHNTPATNSWFVLRRDSSDWDRLRQEGFRLVAHGSREHVLLAQNATKLISSHLDWYVLQPFQREALRRGGWRLVWLQHGVTKDDLSRWVNPKPITLMISATTAEQDSFVADGTPYEYTTREVKLTGFPRHDRLGELGTRSEKRRLLVCPTWRRFLVRPDSTPEERLAEFKQSDYVRAWEGLLNDDELRAVCEENGLTLTFMPHPNMAGFLSEFAVPDHCEVRAYASTDIQEMMAGSALLVTDYSSLAFDMAYLDAATVYFQFDAEEFFSGVHPYRRGYWSYEDDGFGPVTQTTAETTDAVVALLRDGVPPGYVERMQATMALRDGQACARVHREILALDRADR